MFCRKNASTDQTGRFLDRIIQSAALAPASRLAIAGGGIEALIRLMKLGFTQAASVRPDRALASEGADAFLVLDVPPTATVAATLHQAHAALRPQGILAIRDAHPETGARVRAWARLARRNGFAAVAAVPFGEGCIVTARRRDLGAGRAAA